MGLDELTWRQRGELWLRLAIRALLMIAAVWLVWRFGPPLLSLFAPFVCALIAAALLNGPVRRLQRLLGWNRSLLSFLVLIVLFALVGVGAGLLGYAAVGQLVSLVQNWSGLLDSLQSTLDQVEVLLSNLLTLVPPQITELVQGVVDSLLEWLNVAVPDALAALGRVAGEKAMGLPSFRHRPGHLHHGHLSPHRRLPLSPGPDGPARGRGADALPGPGEGHLPGGLRGYLKAELLLSVGVFFILLIGFFIIHQPYGLLLALGLAVMDFIPIIGAGTVMVPWAFIALFMGDLSTAVELMVIWGVIALFRRVMEPKFVGDQTGLSPILSLVSIYVGMKAGGVLGMILGPTVLPHLPEPRRPWASSTACAWTWWPPAGHHGHFVPPAGGPGGL